MINQTPSNICTDGVADGFLLLLLLDDEDAGECRRCSDAKNWDLTCLRLVTCYFLVRLLKPAHLSVINIQLFIIHQSQCNYDRCLGGAF